ncbi:hypothetical protein TNCV_1816361 [Trichonephila clavipes]|nr:hypothetical protein TNCV_1816361 [Trichonephila clavipes]
MYKKVKGPRKNQVRSVNGSNLAWIYMLLCFPASQQIDRIFYADKITPSTLIRARLTYCKALSFGIMPTARSHETKNICTEPGSRVSNGILDVRRDRPTPGERIERPVGTLEKKNCVLPSFFT